VPWGSALLRQTEELTVESETMHSSRRRGRPIRQSVHQRMQRRSFRRKLGQAAFLAVVVAVSLLAAYLLAG